jgi:RecA-family ATPase
MSVIDPQSLARALGGEARGNEISAPGPGHKSAGDRSLSVKVDPGAPDGFLVHSFADDDPIACKDYIRKKAGLGAFKPNGQRHYKGAGQPKRKIVAEYNYTDESRSLLYQVVRYDPKDFRQRQPDGNGGWIWSLGEKQRVLYRLSEVPQYPDGTVFVCEGEKDADRVASLGHCATTVASGKWTSDCIKPLAGRDIIILQDNDGAGEQKAQAAAQALHSVAKTIRIVLLPDLKSGGDVSDWLDADPQRADKLVDVCFDVPEWTPALTQGEETAPPRAPRLLNSAEFVRDFMPPDYLVNGILQRRFIYAITGRTGEGKTTVCLRIAAHVAEGLPLNGAAVSQGRVLYLAGENPDDIRMRWIVLMERMGLDENEIAVDFVDGRFNISEIPGHILSAANQREYALVIVDTSVAFSQSIDENDNVEQLKHAQALRGLIDKLPGGPTILVCCHPPKNASDDNLQPRGGGAVIAEFDGNLTCKRTETVTEVHHQGKFRGPDFAPAHFILEGATTARLKDSRGNLVWSVFARPASEQDQEEISKAVEADLAAIMTALNSEPGLSLAGIARTLGWLTPQGLPNKSKAQRRIRLLEKKKLVERDGERLEITDKGKKWLGKQGKSNEPAPKDGPNLVPVKS